LAAIDLTFEGLAVWCHEKMKIVPFAVADIFGSEQEIMCHVMIYMSKYKYIQFY
jgi:hypothetical protein